MNFQFKYSTNFVHLPLQVETDQKKPNNDPEIQFHHTIIPLLEKNGGCLKILQRSVIRKMIQ